jgi:probable DNA repair protein
MAALAFDGRKTTYTAFLDVLEHQASETIFAPESREAPVQILGPLEAAGLTFDALWFLGADDTSWPAVAPPHPFLSRPLQNQHEMPHANADIDLRLAKQVTARLEQSAPRRVFSYATQNAEGACRPSPLVALGKQPLSAQALRAQMGATDDLAGRHDSPEVLIEQEPTVVVPWPVEQVAGGADVLKLQAACPFHAFANKRLAARAIDETDWGLEASERGSVVHRILEKLWEEMKTRDGLGEAVARGRLRGMAEQATTEALERYAPQGPDRVWGQAYLDAEQERIVALIEEWLAYERQRADFEVEAREDERTASVGELKLKLRVDRIDRVKDGRVIIDYKTGNVSADIWDGARPDEPQLPIYAAYGQVEELKGILLGRVAQGQVKFTGRVENSEAVMRGAAQLTKIPFRAEMMENWQRVLLDLSDQFLRGEARINPKRFPGTCQYCSFSGLCRIAESDRHAEDEADPGDGEWD